MLLLLCSGFFGIALALPFEQLGAPFVELGSVELLPRLLVGSNFATIGRLVVLDTEKLGNRSVFPSTNLFCP